MRLAVLVPTVALVASTDIRPWDAGFVGIPTSAGSDSM